MLSAEHAHCLQRNAPRRASYGHSASSQQAHLNTRAQEETYHQCRQPLARNAASWQNLDSGPGEM